MVNIDPVQLKYELSRILKCLSNQGYAVRELTFKQPALLSEVKQFQLKSNVKLPTSVKDLLISVSAGVDFRWRAPEHQKDYPQPFRSNFCGELNWSFDSLVSAEEMRCRWTQEVFPDIENEYDRVWHNKFGFQSVANGDIIAIETSTYGQGQVVYLSHDGSDNHGAIMGKSLNEFITNWVIVACAGGEDWQWEPFLVAGSTGIDANSSNASAWRKLLNI